MGNRKDCVTPSARTPGSWTARSNMCGVTIVNDDGVAVAKTPCCDRQALADGALLAAAPDLLCALKDALLYSDGGQVWTVNAIAAITKAEALQS